MSKKSFIDSVEVGVPCSEDWENMQGNDRVRFCSHCAKAVQNLSAITRKEATRLMRSSDGNICIRYIKHPETQRPIFGEQLLQITRRTPALAAGIMTASLALSTMSYGQSAPPTPSSIMSAAASGNEAEKEEPDGTESKDDPSLGSIEGFILDLSGKPVSGVAVSIEAPGENAHSSDLSTDADGRYRFEELEPGKYTIRIASASGLMKKAARGIELAQGEKMVRNIYVKVTEVEGGEGVGSGSGSGWGGAMASVEYDLPLNRAVADNDIGEVRRLLSDGERVNGKDKNYNGISPLFIAVENGSVEIVKLLLDHGAEVNAVDETERTPLLFIDSDATPELIRILLDAGAAVNARDKNGNDVLLTAISYISVDVLDELIKGGVDVDQADEAGVTALMMSAEEEGLEKVTALVLAGADVDERDKSGESAWDKTSSPEIEQFLESHGAVVDNGTIEVLQVIVKVETENEETAEPDPMIETTSDNKPAGSPTVR